METCTLAPHGPYIGRCDGESVSLYNLTGATIARDAFTFGDHREARRALRSVRRYHGGPMRLACYVGTEQGDLRGEESEAMYSATCEVYGWRAALVAIRAMRQEMPHGWRTLHLVSDARLDDLMSELRGES